MAAPLGHPVILDTGAISRITRTIVRTSGADFLFVLLIPTPPSLLASYFTHLYLQVRRRPLQGTDLTLARSIHKLLGLWMASVDSLILQLFLKTAVFLFAFLYLFGFCSAGPDPLPGRWPPALLCSSGNCSPRFWLACMVSYLSVGLVLIPGTALHAPPSSLT